MSSNIGLFVNPKSGFVGIGTSRPATALHVEGNMLASGTITASNLSILGDFVTLNTITSNTEQMVIQNAGTGPALKVTQTGANSIAEFYDDGNALAFKVADGGNVGIGTGTPLQKLHVNGDVTITSTGALTIPRGTTAQRPTNPTSGMIRYNNIEDYIETYKASLGVWVPITVSFGVFATGGTVTDISINGIQYRVHTFTSVGTSSLQVLNGGEVDVLLVAGGGGGGAHVPGGGGSGGVVWRTSLYVNAQAYNITVGNGGNGSFNPGGYAEMPNATTGGNTTGLGLTAIGGGFGGSWSQDTRSNNGGSGGGRNTDRNSGQRLGVQPIQSGDSGVFGFGNNGGLNLDPSQSPYGGGGGGGAGSVGQSPTSRSSGGNGGQGINLSSFLTTSVGDNGWFGGGGGGGGWGLVSPIGDGGSGGGGHGDCPQSSGGTGNSARRGVGEPRGFDGAVNTGGGGGGAGRTGAESSRGGNGGSGIAIVRYRIG